VDARLKEASAKWSHAEIDSADGRQRYLKQYLDNSGLEWRSDGRKGLRQDEPRVRQRKQIRLMKEDERLCSPL